MASTPSSSNGSKPKRGSKADREQRKQGAKKEKVKRLAKGLKDVMKTPGAFQPSDEDHPDLE